MALISFIMPNFNKEAYLPEAIESVLSQTLKDIELVVVDDGSTDDSRDIIETFSRRDKRIVPVYLQRDSELHVAVRIDRARNVGNERATSPIICVFDSDDVSLPKRAEITYEAFKQKECGLFYGACHMRNRFGEVDKQIQGLIPAIEFSERRLKETGYFFICHLTVAYRKETILKYPYNSFSGVGDWGMFYTLLVKFNVNPCYTDEPLCIYRVYNNSLNQLDNPEFSKYLMDKKQKKMKEFNES